MNDDNRNINPHYKKKQSVNYTLDQCIEGVIHGKTNILAHLISKAESRLVEDQEFVSELLEKLEPNKRAKKIAISGPPGVGKSSFIDSFGSYLTSRGYRIAVLPVDPSSYISKGSILGDKTRMEQLSVSENAFIKPMSSSLALGGLAPSSSLACMICEKSNFDYIILETVGVGQSEVEAKDIVDLFVVLLQPGGGDELQGIKRGIMELADMFIVTKTDGSLLKNAEITTKELRQISALLLPNSFGWKAKVFNHSALLNQGNDTILNEIFEYYDFMTQDDRLQLMIKSQQLNMFAKKSKDLIFQHIMRNRKISDLMGAVKQELNAGSLSAIEALNKLKKRLNEIS